MCSKAVLENMENMHDPLGHFFRHTEKSNRNARLKNTLTRMKNALHRLLSILDTTKYTISEPKAISSA